MKRNEDHKYEIPIEKFLELVESWAPPRDHNCSSMQEKSDVSWDLGADFDDAIALARKGWPEGREYLHKVSKDLEIACGRPQAEMKYAVCGEPDIGRFLAGEPECCVDHSDSDSRRIIRIAIQGGFNAGVTSDEVIRMGAYAMAIVDAIELAGHRAEIVVVSRTNRPASDIGISELTYSVIVKSAHQPMDRDLVTYAIAHPAFFRRLGFRFIEWACAEHGGASGGYGQPLVIDATSGDVVITVNDTHNYTPAEYVRSALKKLGIIPDTNDNDTNDDDTTTCEYCDNGLCGNCGECHDCCGEDCEEWDE